MSRPHFSIASLLVVIGVLAIGLAAFRNPSYLWANVTFSVAFAAIVLAIINTIYGRGANRAYWLGFALCGGTYFATCTVPGIRESLCPRLATEVIFDVLYPLFSTQSPPPPPARPATVAIWRRAKSAGPGGIRVPIGVPPPPDPASRWAAWSEPDRTNGLGDPIGTVSLVSSEAFRQIGHALATLLVAVLGATYARRRFEGANRNMPSELDH